MESPLALVVEDDADISSVLVATLQAAGFKVATAADGRSAVAACQQELPDLVTLDLTLPQMDGIEVARQIREMSDCYIMIVSARADEIDRLIGLEVGADDYMLKPFSPRELRARVAALFRRPRGAAEEPPAVVELSSVPRPNASANTQSFIDCGATLVVVPERREVEIGGNVVDLTRIEYDVLEHLAKNIGRVCTREEMVRAIWSSDLAHDQHLVDVHVANLRAKLRRHDAITWIHTVRSIGYRLDFVGESRGSSGSGGPGGATGAAASFDWAREEFSP